MLISDPAPDDLPLSHDMASARRTREGWCMAKVDSEAMDKGLDTGLLLAGLTEGWRGLGKPGYGQVSPLLQRAFYSVRRTRKGCMSSQVVFGRRNHLVKVLQICLVLRQLFLAVLWSLFLASICSRSTDICSRSSSRTWNWQSICEALLEFAWSILACICS